MGNDPFSVIKDQVTNLLNRTIQDVTALPTTPWRQAEMNWNSSVEFQDSVNGTVLPPRSRFSTWRQPPRRTISWLNRTLGLDPLTQSPLDLDPLTQNPLGLDPLTTSQPASWYGQPELEVNVTSGVEPSSWSTSLNAEVTVGPVVALVTTSNADSMVPGGLYDTPLVIAGKITALLLICLIGSCGNFLVIWSIVKERHLHRPPFYFLLSLGVTDLSRAVFCVPVVISTILHSSSWRHGESACKLSAFASSFFVFSSALSLLAIAVDRHTSVVHAPTYRRRGHGLVNLLGALLVWLIAFSISFPPVLGVGAYVFVAQEAHCTFRHRHYSYNDSSAFVLIFSAIVALTYFLYFRIFKFMRAHRRMRPLQHHQPARSSTWAFVGPGANGQAFINWLNGFGGQGPARPTGQRTAQRLNFGRVVNLSSPRNEHLTRLFLIVSIVFGVAWAPYVVLSMWRVFGDATLLPASLVTASAWLGYAQVAMTSVTYVLSRGPVRRPLRTSCSDLEKKDFLLENKMRK